MRGQNLIGILSSISRVFLLTTIDHVQQDSIRSGTTPKFTIVIESHWRRRERIMSSGRAHLSLRAFYSWHSPWPSIARATQGSVKEKATGSFGSALSFEIGCMTSRTDQWISQTMNLTKLMISWARLYASPTRRVWDSVFSFTVAHNTTSYHLKRLPIAQVVSFQSVNGPPCACCMQTSCPRVFPALAWDSVRLSMQEQIPAHLQLTC
jgi:hypothetical protein